MKQPDKNTGGGLGRRDFLKLALGTGAAAVSGLSIPRFVRASEELFDEGTKTVHTVCAVCSGGCAGKAQVKDGRLVRLLGNPDDLAAEGRLCVKAYSATRTLYDPDRLKFPMKRTNPEKGIGIDPGFVKISWEEAIELTAEKLNAAIRDGGPESVMFIHRSHDFANRLGKAIGTPNFISHNSTCYTTQQAAWAGVVGSGKPWTYDVANCRYILGFGWDGLGKAKNMHLRNTTRALANGAKLVILDPRLSVTASKAHEWIPVKPGTDLAFCLAMMNVIISEKLYDRDFVQKYTSGFEELEQFSKQYTPEWASEITEIPADTIARIAREFATTRPAHIHSHKRDAAGPNYSNSYRLAQAQLILNTLVGTIDRPGGTLLPRNPSFPGFDSVFPPPPFPQARKERIDGFEKSPIVRSGGNFATLTEGILTQKPYPVKAAIVRSYNVLSFPNSVRAAEALSTLDFMACFEIYPSEMAHLADVVLPEPHWLEASTIVPRSYMSMHPQVAIRSQAVEPLYDTKGFGGVIASVAKAMGYGEYFEGVSGSKFDDERLKAVGTSLEELSQSPNGLWEDKRPFVPTETFRTPSTKIELYSSVFEQHGYDPLPYWAPKREMPSDDYPLYYLISRPAIHKMTQTQNNPLAMEIYPENKAIMHVSLGQQLGIRDGDEVHVESRVGKIRIKARLIEGIRPDCVCVEHGFGHWSRDLTLAYSKGASDGDLIPDMTIAEQEELRDPGAGACMCDVCVRVYKA